MDSSDSVNEEDLMIIEDENVQSKNSSPNDADANQPSQNQPSGLSNVSDEDVIITDVRVNTQNQRSSYLNNGSDLKIKGNKRKLKKTFQSVSLLDKSTELNNHDEPKLNTNCHIDNDNDEPEIIDVIIGDEPEVIDVILPEEKASNKLSEMSAIYPSKNSSNTSENISDVHIQLEEKSQDEEPISVDVEMNPKNDSSASENITDLHIQLEEAQNKNENPVPVNVEDLNSNFSEKINVENTIGITGVTEHEIPCDSDEPVIIGEIPGQKASTKLLEMSAIDPSKDSSNTSENISDVHIQLEEKSQDEEPISVDVEMNPENDSNTSENISDVQIQLEEKSQDEEPISVDVEMNPKNDSSASENITDLHIQLEEAQNKNEKPVPVNVEDLNSNFSEKINVENTVGITEVEHEIPCESSMCDDMIDFSRGCKCSHLSRDSSSDSEAYEDDYKRKNRHCGKNKRCRRS